MLVRMECENFRSFKDRVVFSMETGSRLRWRKEENTFAKQGYKLLKSAFIFGGNASGKTNVLLALVLLSNLIEYPTQSEVDELATDTFSYNEEPTIFLVEFIKSKKSFIYSLRYNAKEVIEESLTVNNQLIFSKENGSFTLPEKLKVLEGTVRKNQLLLYFCQNNNIEEAKEAYEWFVKDLILIEPRTIYVSQLLKLKKPEFKEKVLTFLKAADFNITDLYVVDKKEAVPDTDSLPTLKKRQINTVEVYTEHKDSDGNPFQIGLSQESRGTQTFLRLALYMLDNYNDSKVFLLDEFEESLHIRLAEILMKLFNQWNTKNQFITTTHNFNLMDNDLRSDQIWFVEKNHYGESDLYSLFDFDDERVKKKNISYKKDYLIGRYGADQIINYSLLHDVLGVEDE